ncbi:sulfatase [Haloarcula sp. JP-L23]|uniref:sulfatase n=1 Tax=Haloarcula sp. JP-L23 TaxID=2716717 RepID=UPI00140E98C0|nr:sulfatase [Haloarcula sp. JP-L23]
MATPNIVWVTLDSVRADHTTMHGYRRDTTPELAALARDGVAFETCIAHSSRTPVSVPSMLTGTYPSRHGVGLGAGVCGRIPDTMATVPDILRDCGYTSVAVSRNVYAGEVTGLADRFDRFVSPTLRDDLLSYPFVRSLAKYGAAAHRHSGGLTLDKQRHPKSFLVSDVAKRVLAEETRGADSVFLYLHYNDPHRPYYPPASFRDRYTTEAGVDPDAALDFARDMHEHAYEYMAKGLPFSETQWEMLYAMYDAAIAYTDHCLGSLLTFIREQVGETIVVVTADHGELFGEYGLLGHHIVLDDAITHTPLVVSGCPELERAREDVVQHVDVMQTIVSMVGGDTSQFQGYDLRSECRPFAVSQDLRGTVVDPNRQDYERIRQHNPEFDTTPFHRSLLTTLRTNEFRLQHTDEWRKLHHLPDERTVVNDTYPDVYSDLTARLTAWLETYGQPYAESRTEESHSPRTRERLREMGYLE